MITKGLYNMDNMAYDTLYPQHRHLEYSKSLPKPLNGGKKSKKLQDFMSVTCFICAPVAASRYVYLFMRLCTEDQNVYSVNFKEFNAILPT